MVNNTVKKKGISEGAAGLDEKVKTTAVAWQNNKPQKLEIEVTNSQEIPNLPFLIENGDKVVETGSVVIIRAKANTREDMEALKAQKGKSDNIEAR